MDIPTIIDTLLGLELNVMKQEMQQATTAAPAIDLRGADLQRLPAETLRVAGAGQASLPIVNFLLSDPQVTYVGAASQQISNLPLDTISLLRPWSQFHFPTCQDSAS